MPGKDRTGPEGLGSRTGRAMGKCRPKNQNGDVNIVEDDLPKGRGRGQGQGRGQGRGFGNGKGMGRGRS